MIRGQAAGHSSWDDRIARARLLAEARPAAAELLEFYARLAAFQRELVAGAPDHRREVYSGTAADLVECIDIDGVLDAIPRLFDWLSQTAPARFDNAAIPTVARDDWRDLILTRLAAPGRTARGALDATPDATAAGGDAAVPADDGRLSTFIVEAVLQPFVEPCAIQAAVPPGLETRFPMRCPCCASLPIVAVLREEGHGAKRLLSCGLCGREWECGRIVCPACGEEEFERLPVYTAEQFAHVRIEACDRCRAYAKAIDLTKDGHAIALVDDIASVTLDLWARERGYVRLKRNLLGL